MQILIYLIIGSICFVMNVAIFCVPFHGGIGIAIATDSLFGSAVVNYFLCITIFFHHKADWDTFGEIVAYLETVPPMGSSITV